VAYRGNARRVPSVSGLVVPERVFTRADYEGVLLQRIYDDLAPLDPDGVLRHEWVNARGCIARFDRMALEIRLLDIQEHPLADLAVAAAVVAVVRALVDERLSSYEEQRSWHEKDLAAVLSAAIVDADEAFVEDERLIRAFGHPGPAPLRLRDLWQHLIDELVEPDPAAAEWLPALRLILSEGCLARRIVKATGEQPSAGRLLDVYERLAECLAKGMSFRAQT
jgi:hypothetical protein